MESEEVVEPQIDEVASETPEEPEEVKAPEEPVDREVEARRQLTARAKAAEAKAKELETKLAQVNKAKGNSPLAVEDYIDISTSLDGLDQREKAYLAEQHRLTGKPLKEIRDGEDFELWDSAYKQKQEKERALRPNTTQAEEESPKTMVEALRNKSLAEKEELLKKAGLYKESRPRTDRASIGNTRTR